MASVCCVIVSVAGVLRSTMTTNVLEIDPQRLWEHARALGRDRPLPRRRPAAAGAVGRGQGDARPVRRWAKEAGCTVEIDRLGNIFARRAGSDPSLPPVAIGSHLDTQICGGRYDGILGVLCGLEVVRTLNDRGLATKRGIEVICWTNEEGGRFAPPMMGSMAFAGVLPLKDVLATTDDDGITVEQALDRIGYAGSAPLGGRSSTPISSCISSRHRCSTARRCDVGIVVGGYKTRALRLTIKGDTGHAGGTPMAMRRNALVGAGYVIARGQRYRLGLCRRRGPHDDDAHRELPQPARHLCRGGEADARLSPYRPCPLRGDGQGHRGGNHRGGEEGECRDRCREGWSWGTELFAPECIDLLSRQRKSSACRIARCVARPATMPTPSRPWRRRR